MMELQHLHFSHAVAEELHCARAAEKLHVEQSPLSRAIKELEEELGVVLFARTTRSTQLTRAGKLFFEHVPRVFSALQQARDSVKAAVNGFRRQLRVALSDGMTPSRLPALLALCRQEEPEVETRLFEIPLSQQIKGLHDDLHDLEFAQSDEVGGGAAGYAGLEDDVDYRCGRIFAGAAMRTLLGVGAEPTVPENRLDGDRIIIAARGREQMVTIRESVHTRPEIRDP